MCSRIRFVPAETPDYPELEQMILGLYSEDPSTEGMSREKIHRTFLELSGHPDRGVMLLFKEAQAILGYAILIHFWSNEYGGVIEVIDELYVKPEGRGRGIGSAFLEHLSHNAGSEIKGLLLEVTPRNRRARALYTRHGFTLAKNQHLFKALDAN